MSAAGPIVLPSDGVDFPLTVPLLIIGGGAAGLTAALAARDEGVDVLVLERDPVPRGSTALSSGFVPAAATSFQKAKGVEDSPALLARDIQAKAKGQAEPHLVAALSHGIGPTIDWLAATHRVPFQLIEGFLYPGHSVLRMHGTSGRTGAELMDFLTQATERAGVDIVTNAHVQALYADAAGRVVGAQVDRPDGSTEAIGCAVLVLACSGFGGNPALVKQHIPEMSEALYFGHTGNQGDAIAWGTALGAATRDLGAYQGHGSVAVPHNILITWALIMEGGFQVNVLGERFSNEQQGYSEQSVAVLAQPGGIAWTIFDRRLHELGLEFEDYRHAVDAGAIKSAPDIAVLAVTAGLPAEVLRVTLEKTRYYVDGTASDPFGRRFVGKPALAAPFYAVKVTGALFHTQGGLLVDETARVLRADRTHLPNLIAAGGAAAGVSGAAVWGYLSGNGLLAAIGLGRIAGVTAARQVAAESRGRAP